MEIRNPAPPKPPSLNAPRPVAVIDIGSTAIRMTIAQIDQSGSVHRLETLQQALTLGKDTFTKGYIRKASIEDCVRAVKSFRRTLQEYEINQNDQIRIVATTAVREAINHETFIDRIFMATGLKVDVLEDVDVVRLTYLSVRALLAKEQFPRASDILVAEMSGGSTELLLFQNGNVTMSKTYRLGSLRLREMVEVFRAPMARQRKLMENDIQRTIEQIHQTFAPSDSMILIGVGGDMRFAASELQPEWNPAHVAKLPLQALGKLADELLGMSVDEIVHRFHLTFADAETAGPSLLFYHQLAKAFNLKAITVTDLSMRYGLLVEMAMRGAWTEDFAEQIILSALEYGRRFQFDEAHALHVAYLSGVLFRALKNEHRLDSWYELLLHIAALLHDIGSYISVRSHHKHSMYLIQNSEIFGLNRKDIQLTALVARYHRRSAPKQVHEEYTALDMDSRLTVSKLAAILRVADALDRSNSQRIRDIECLHQDDRFTITVPKVDDLTLEELGLQNKGTMFEDVFGMSVILRKQSQKPE